MGGGRVPIPRKIFNTIFVFVLSGLWHAPDWTYVMWGVYNGLLFIPLILFPSQRYKDTVAHGKLLPTWREFFSILLTFMLINFARIFSRAPNMASFWDFTRRLFSPSILDYHGLTKGMATALLWCAALLVAEWFQREKSHVLEIDGYRIFSTQLSRLALYAFIFFLIFYFSAPVQTFIYFQF